MPWSSHGWAGVDLADQLNFPLAAACLAPAAPLHMLIFLAQIGCAVWVQELRQLQRSVESLDAGSLQQNMAQLASQVARIADKLQGTLDQLGEGPISLPSPSPSTLHGVPQSALSTPSGEQAGITMKAQVYLGSAAAMQHE